MISIVVGVVKSTRAIGRDGDLIHRLPDDLKRFRRITWGHPVIFGRKTYESIGSPLPGRTNIVITSNEQFDAPGCTVVSSLDEAVAAAKESPGGEEIFIGGGENLYDQMMPDMVDSLYITEIAGDEDGDTHFPQYSEFTKVVMSEIEETKEPNYKFVVLEKE